MQRNQRFSRWVARVIFAVLALTADAGLSVPHDAFAAEWTTLEHAPSPVDNPLKGLVPYANPPDGSFPHSLEFDYLALGKIITAENQYNWEPLETRLDQIASRGNQAVLRFYLEYPGKRDGIPAYLIAKGLQVHSNLEEKTAQQRQKLVLTPNYEDPDLRRALQQFIAALGERYDGDPRLGYLTAGLLGIWGEWHNYPHEELFASPAVQEEVLTAYSKAFRKTPILLRYPAGSGNDQYTPNVGRGFGYHDDSFAWGTRITGRPDDDWYFLALLTKSGAEGLNTWQTCPIGGEIRPEVWGCVFDAKPCTPAGQEFDVCVQETHATWLMDSGMFREKPIDAERRNRAEIAVRKLGYDLHVPAVKIERSPETWQVSVQVTNQGVAPWYADWPIELGWLDRAERSVVVTHATDWQLQLIAPGETREFTATLPWPEGTTPDRLVPGLRVVHPLANGKPLRFANATQDHHVAGWLSLNE